MNPLQYDHYYDDKLKAAQRQAEDAKDAAIVRKKEWITQVTEQAAIDILDRMTDIQQRAEQSNLSEDQVRAFAISDLKMILRLVIGAVQYADERIG